ncbi:flagellar FlbD family protein [Effusibacillus pohliae]|uniref:flagellar FlbD family protein n=1 Tax=Effusibacillus pohliae TaxID=232270 RepID=UPI0003767F16|nr:flagellar FlbD family protein [Effusibacillus pohliae]
MIRVTRFNGSELMLNATLVETVEATPDTVITLVTNKKIVVKESVEEVADRITGYYKTIGLIGRQERPHTG